MRGGCHWWNSWELGGTLIPDGPAMVKLVKSLVVILVLKLVEAIGKKFDKKKPVKEDLTQIDELINPNINLPFGGDRITHNHGGGESPFLVETAALVSGAAAMACQQKEEERRRRRKEKTRRRKEKTIQNNQ